MTNPLHQFFRGERGEVAAEYALLLLIILSGISVAFVTFKNTISTSLNGTSALIASGWSNQGGGGGGGGNNNNGGNGGNGGNNNGGNGGNNNGGNGGNNNGGNGGNNNGGNN